MPGVCAPVNVDYINPFLNAAVNVFRTMAACELKRGTPYLADSDQPALEISGIIGLSGKAIGTVVLVGVPNPQATLELPFIEIFGRGGSLKSSWYGDCLPSRDFPMLIDLYLQGRLNLDGFVSETIGLDAVEEAFHKMERGEVLRSVVVL